MKQNELLPSYSGISQYLYRDGQLSNRIDCRSDIDPFPSRLLRSHLSEKTHAKAQEMSFLSYSQENQRNPVNMEATQQTRANKEIHSEDNDFTLVERNSLKNAFRYICRLTFKEAKNFESKLAEICLEVGYEGQSNLAQRMLADAESVSGERYFREYIATLQSKERQIIVKYMIWFLRVKYLRYIQRLSQVTKGKRRVMRTELYIRFKNKVLLPYLEHEK